MFAINESTATLTFLETQNNGAGGIAGMSYARALVLSPDGAQLYVAADGALVAFTRNMVDGTLSHLQTLQNGSGGISGLTWSNALQASPDGAHVYITSGVDNTVAVFARNTGTGLLTFVEVLQDGVGGVSNLANPYSVVIRHDGAFVYVSALSSVVWFARNATTGQLTYVSATAKPGLTQLTLAGNHLYGVGGGYLEVLASNATGMLSLIEVHYDGQAGVDGIEGSQGITVSGDGAQV